jgi:hypothetical protein
MREVTGWRLRQYRIISILLSCLLATLVVELSLWVFAPIPFHEWMEWIPDGHIKGRAKPFQKFKGGTGHHVTAATGPDGKKTVMHEVHINGLGFRGPEYSWRPAPGTLRLVAFGGSAGFCYHQKEEDTWPGRLQNYLREKLTMPVEVINLALPGFDSANSKINYLFAARELHPHAALFYHTWNDLKFFRAIERSPTAAIFAEIAENKPIWQRLGRETQIGRRARNFLLARFMKGLSEYHEPQYTSLASEGAGAGRPVSHAPLEWAKGNFSDFARFAKADHVLPVLITQATLIAQENLHKPECQIISPDMVGMTWPVLLEAWAKMNGLIKEVCQQQSAIFIDGYNAVPHSQQYLEDHVHLTTEGCDVLARIIAEALMQDQRFVELANHVRQKSDRGPSDDSFQGATSMRH